MKVNFSGLQAKKLNGDLFTVSLPDGSKKELNLAELMGDIIYTQTSGIRFGRIAQDIFDGRDVELNELEVGFLIELVSSDDCQKVLPVKFALINYLASLIKKTDKDNLKK